MKKMLLSLFLFAALFVFPFTFAHGDEVSIQEKAIQFLPMIIAILVGAFIVYKVVKKLLFVTFAALFIIIGILIAGYYYSGSGNVVNDQNALDSILELQKISSEKNITLEDITQLKELIKNDEIAHSYYDEMEWLIENGEPEHSLHSLAFLKTYIKTGDSTFCIPHELEHVEIYLKHNQTERAMNTISEIKENLKPWIEKSENARKQFPQYYKNFDTLKNETISVVELLSAKNFTPELFERVKIVEENGIC